MTTDTSSPASPMRGRDPDVKINHVLFLGGDQGIGKDTIFAGLERAVGFSNYRT